MNVDRVNVLYVVEFITGGSVESLHSLVTGLDKSRYIPTVLFYREPASVIRQRFEDAGATVAILFPEEPSGGSNRESRGFNLQASIRRLFGRHIEEFYASLKYVYVFLRYKMPVYFALRRQFSTLPVGIIHLNNGLASDMPGILAAVSCKLPVICHVRAFSVHTRLHVWASRYVSLFLCVSNAVREHIVAVGVNPVHAVVCYDSVNQQRFRKTDVSCSQLLSEFGWNDSNTVYAVIGRLDSWKGHDYFIEAIDLARSTNASIRGLIVGELTPSERNDSYVENLHAQIDKLELTDFIQFAGHRTNIPEIVQCVDAVICSSSSPEPFGLMVVESMAVGIPIIATNAGGPAEMITDDENGLLVPMKDASAMAEAMLRIANDVDLVQKLSAAGELTVAKRFTVAHHVQNVCNAYRIALGSQI